MAVLSTFKALGGIHSTLAIIGLYRNCIKTSLRFPSRYYPKQKLVSVAAKHKGNLLMTARNKKKIGIQIKFRGNTFVAASFPGAI